MKEIRVIMFFTGFISFINGDAQQKVKIDSLEHKRIIISKMIGIYEDSLNQVKKEIERHNLQQLRTKRYIVATLKYEVPVTKESSIGSDRIGDFKKGDTVHLHSQREYHYYASKGDVVGYIPVKAINETVETIDFYNMIRAREVLENAERIKRENEEFEAKLKQDQAAADKKRRANIQTKFAKYGQQTVEDIYRGKIWIGMTSEMAKYSLGEPNSINESVGRWGRNEQWVYDNLYLYFDNSKLSSYQKSH